MASRMQCSKCLCRDVEIVFARGHAFAECVNCGEQFEAEETNAIQLLRSLRSAVTFGARETDAEEETQ